MLRKTRMYLPATVSQDWDYDRFGNLKQHTFNDGTAHASAYNFNKLNQLTSATLPGNQNYSATYYTGSQQRKQITHPSGITTDYAYYNHGPVQSITTADAAALQLEQFSYNYDANLNIDDLTSSREVGVHDYVYDGLDRLTQASHPATTGLATEQFTYDQGGNREDPADSALYDYDGNNRITASPSLTYSHDVDGNQISRSDGMSYSYNKDNRLIAFTDANEVTNNATYQYDSFGRRISKTVNGQKTWFLWAGTRLTAEYDSTGTRQQRYSYLPADFVPIQTTDINGSYTVHSNHLQTPKFLTDQSQAIVWSQFDKAFGEATVDADVDGDSTLVAFNVRFPGQYFDSETGLHYNYFRDYDPGLGRYIQSDPIGLGGGINMYVYANQNPLLFIDPNATAAQAICLIWPLGTAACAVAAVGTAIAVKMCSDGVDDVQEALDNAEIYRTEQEKAIDCLMDPSCSGSTAQQSANTAQQALQETIENAASATENLGRSIPGTSVTGPIPTSVLDLTTGAVRDAAASE